jgi:hypothetical protein
MFVKKRGDEKGAPPFSEFTYFRAVRHNQTHLIHFHPFQVDPAHFETLSPMSPTCSTFLSFTPTSHRYHPISTDFNHFHPRLLHCTHFHPFPIDSTPFQLSHPLLVTFTQLHPPHTYRPCLLYPLTLTHIQKVS